MSRNSVAHHSAGQSFMGLLASLTEDIQAETSDSASARSYRSDYSDSSCDSPSGPGHVPGTVSASDAKRAKRPLTPVAELKSGRNTGADCTQLSYEKALQLHGRHRRKSEIDDFAGNIPPSRIPSPSAASGSDNAPKRETLVAPSKIEATQSQRHEIDAPKEVGTPQPTVNQKRTQTRAKASPGLSKDPVGAASAAFRSTDPMQHPQTQEAKRPNLPLEPATIQTKRASAKTTHASNSKTSFKPEQNSGSVRNPAAGLNSSNRQGVARKAGRLDRSVAASDRKSNAENAIDHVDLNFREKDVHRSSLVLKKNASMDQRRTILSVRLTGEELEKLKDRADESGISVSAYMRLCVLDADQLRAQVKQVLAEMRALHRESEPNRLPALVGTSQSRESNGATWFHIVLRSAAFLLSPLFPFRRSA